MTDAPRDPRIDPRRGDIIRQPCGLALRVVDAQDGWVAWQESDLRRMHQWGNHTRWSLKGWRNVVAADAEVLESSHD